MNWITNKKIAIVSFISLILLLVGCEGDPITEIYIDDLYAATGRTATFVVAASDASAQSKAQADYVCDGTSDDVQIQAAIDALPTNGGKIQLTEGQYVLSSTVLLDSGTTIQGQMGNRYIPTTRLVLGNGVNNNILENRNGGGTEREINILDLTIDGNYLNQTAGNGIELANTSRVVIQNIEVGNTFGHGIYFSANSQIVLIDHITSVGGIQGSAIYGDTNLYDAWIQNCDLNAADYCIYLNAGGNTVTNNFLYSAARGIYLNTGADFCSIANNRVASCDYGIYSVGQWVTITGNYVANCNNEAIRCNADNTVVGNIIEGDKGGSYTTRGILVVPASGSRTIIANNVIWKCTYGIETQEPSNIIIDGNSLTGINSGDRGIWLNYVATPQTGHIITNNEINSYATGIFIEANISSCIVKNNNITGATTAINNSGANIIIGDNIGYKIENYGTATVASGTTSIVVNHGLATTPTEVYVTPAENPTNPVSFWWVDTYTATQFTIHVDADPGASNLDFEWQAHIR